MIKHIGQHYQQSSTAAVEERVHALEGRVAALADAVCVPAYGLEDLPTARTGAKACRRSCPASP